MHGEAVAMLTGHLAHLKLWAERRGMGRDVFETQVGCMGDWSGTCGSVVGGGGHTTRVCGAAGIAGMVGFL